MLLVEDPTHVFSVDNYILLLGECRRRKSFKHSHTLYLHICGNGLEADHKLGNHLVPTFVECGNICEAHQIFNKLLYHNEHSWTALLQGYAEKEEFENTLSIWGRMQLSGVHPSRHTFVPLLKVCSMMNYVDQERKRRLALTKVHKRDILFQISRNMFMIIVEQCIYHHNTNSFDYVCVSLAYSPTPTFLFFH